MKDKMREAEKWWNNKKNYIEGAEFDLSDEFDRDVFFGILEQYSEHYFQSKLPSEEEMEREFKEYLHIDIIPDKNDPDHYDYSWGRVVWMACYDHIKKLFER